jgi:two-component system, NarL family, response regulator NreC
MPTRILITDDHGVLRAALRALLKNEADMEVVGEAADGTEALRLAAELHPDVILLDMSMPGVSGMEVARELHQTLPDVRVLVLTVHEDEYMVREALQVGAAGYIIKRAFDTELINAIRSVANGDLYVHPALTRILVREHNAPAVLPHTVSSLTRREMEVLQLIARGYTNAQVAEELSLSVRTVETHRSNLMDKLGLSNRVEIVRYAQEHGLLDK